MNIYACSFQVLEEARSGAPLCRCVEVARTSTPAMAAVGCLPQARPCTLHLGCMVLYSPFNNTVKGIPWCSFTSGQTESCGNLLQPQAPAWRSQGLKPASLAWELTLLPLPAPLLPQAVLREGCERSQPSLSQRLAFHMKVKNVNQNLLLGEHMHCCKFVFKKEKIFGNCIS